MDKRTTFQAKEVCNVTYVCKAYRIKYFLHYDSHLPEDLYFFNQQSTVITTTYRSELRFLIMKEFAYRNSTK